MTRSRIGVLAVKSVGAAEDALLGRRCAVCSEPLYGRRHRPTGICRPCTRRLYNARIEAQDRCELCGRPLISERARCTSCRGVERSFVNNVSPLEYRNHGDLLIRACKVTGLRRSIGLAAELLAPLIPRVDVLVPVPSRMKAVVRRGFDPVQVLVQHLAVRLGIPSAPFLVRISGGSAQKKLGREARAENVRGRYAFNGTYAGRLSGTSSGSSTERLSEESVRSPEGVSLCLVDDVYTTGATAEECSRVLAAAGAGPLFVRTLAVD